MTRSIASSRAREISRSADILMMGGTRSLVNLFDNTRSVAYIINKHIIDRRTEEFVGGI
jgi:hypothetical protein